MIRDFERLTWLHVETTLEGSKYESRKTRKEATAVIQARQGPLWGEVGGSDMHLETVTTARAHAAGKDEVGLESE